jgi:hypothetical protein
VCPSVPDGHLAGCWQHQPALQFASGCLHQRVCRGTCSHCHSSRRGVASSGVASSAVQRQGDTRSTLRAVVAAVSWTYSGPCLRGFSVLLCSPSGGHCWVHSQEIYPYTNVGMGWTPGKQRARCNLAKVHQQDCAISHVQGKHLRLNIQSASSHKATLSESGRSGSGGSLEGWSTSAGCWISRVDICLLNQLMWVKSSLLNNCMRGWSRRALQAKLCLSSCHCSRQFATATKN